MDVPELRFTEACDWLDERIGRTVRATVSTGAENAGAYLHGALTRDDDAEVTLINAPRGRIVAYGVGDGDGQLNLLEGELSSARLARWPEPHGQLLTLSFVHVHIAIWDVEDERPRRLRPAPSARPGGPPRASSGSAPPPGRG